MRFLLLAVIASAITLMGTEQRTRTYPPIQLNYREVASYLHLTSPQLQSLKTIQESKNQAQLATVKMITEKQQQLNALLDANTGDAMRIGQLSIDLYTLRKQSGTTFEPFHSQSIAVLNPEQQSKLADLAHALELESAASQAVMLSLISPLPAKGAGQAVFYAGSATAGVR
jgi:hypothetical protein